MAISWDRVQTHTNYQEIATSGFALLAMTAVILQLILLIQQSNHRRPNFIRRAVHSDQSSGPNGVI